MASVHAARGLRAFSKRLRRRPATFMLQRLCTFPSVPTVTMLLEAFALAEQFIPAVENRLRSQRGFGR